MKVQGLKTFDVYIRRMNDYVAQMEAEGRHVRVFQAPLFKDQLKKGLPVRVGPGANPGIILRGDTSVELGNPEVGSCAFSLFTDDCSRLQNGRITLIGPDIGESEETSLPFGQVLIIGGADLENKDYEAISYTGFVGDDIEGYMVRSMPQSVWSRVSKEAVSKGFAFEYLGRAIMAVYKSHCPEIDAMEIIFVTSNRGDLKPLEDIGMQVQKITREIVKENWKVRGYDIDCALDCSTCSDKNVCDDIREVLRAKGNSV